MRWSWSPWAAFWRCFVRVRLSRSGATRAARATGHGTNGGSNSNPMHSKPPLPPWRGESRGVLPRTNQRTGCDGVRITPGLGDWSGDSKGQGRTQETWNRPPGLGPIDAFERDAVSLAGRNESVGGPDHMLPDEPDRQVNIRPLWDLEGQLPRRSGRGSKGVTTPGCVIMQFQVHYKSMEGRNES